MLISRLFQFFFKPLQLFIEVVVAIDAEVIADAAAVGGDGLVVRDAIEAEQLLQAGEVGIGDADGLFIR